MSPKHGPCPQKASNLAGSHAWHQILRLPPRKKAFMSKPDLYFKGVLMPLPAEADLLFSLLLEGPTSFPKSPVRFSFSVIYQSSLMVLKLVHCLCVLCVHTHVRASSLLHYCASSFLIALYYTRYILHDICLSLAHSEGISEDWLNVY